MPKKDEFITLKQAADLAGYRSTAGLRRAADDKRLKALKVGPRAWLTTEAWVQEYISSRRPWGKERGRPNDEAVYRRKEDTL
jgi:hypothetical protein